MFGNVVVERSNWDHGGNYKVKKPYFCFAITRYRMFLLFTYVGWFISSAANSSAAPFETVTISQTSTNTYIIDVTAVYDIDPHLLLSICYDPRRLRQYLPKWIIIKILKEDETMHVLAYQGKFLFYTHRSVYMRHIDVGRNKISFSHIESSQDNALFPKIGNSDGFYEIFRTKNGSRLHYQQTTTTVREVSDHNLWLAKMQIKKYFSRLRRYINSTYPKEQ